MDVQVAFMATAGYYNDDGTVAEWAGGNITGTISWEAGGVSGTSSASEMIPYHDGGGAGWMQNGWGAIAGFYCLTSSWEFEPYTAYPYQNLARPSWQIDGSTGDTYPEYGGDSLDYLSIAGNGTGTYAFCWWTDPISQEVMQFQVADPTVPVELPEAGTFTLLISALMGLAGAFYLRRRRAKA